MRPYCHARLYSALVKAQSQRERCATPSSYAGAAALPSAEGPWGTAARQPEAITPSFASALKSPNPCANGSPPPPPRLLGSCRAEGSPGRQP